MIFNLTDEPPSQNMTSVCPEEPDSSLVKIVKTFSYCIMLVLALGGNVLLVCVVSSQRKLRTTTNCLISNMAIGDLLVPIFAMPRTIVEIHMGHRRWLLTGALGEGSCKIIYFLQDVSTAVSVLSLSVITIDRFYAIVLPERRTPIKGRVKPVILGIWGTAMLMHAPYLYTFKLVTDMNASYCVLLWPENIDKLLATKCFFLTLIVLLYFIPFFLIAILQAMIVKRLKNQRLPSFSSSCRQRKRLKRNKNVVHFTLAVIITFFICWTPTVVYSFVLIFGGYNCISDIFRFASLFLVQSNSSINFFIYFIFNQTFRKTFKKIIHDRKISLKQMGRSQTIQLPINRDREPHQKTGRLRTITCETLPDTLNDYNAKRTITPQLNTKSYQTINEPFHETEALVKNQNQYGINTKENDGKQLTKCGSISSEEFSG